MNYEISNWNLLTDELLRNADNIDALNKAQLIDDSFTLAYDKKLPFEIPLKLATYLTEETDPIPWITGLKHLKYLYSYFEASSFESHIKVGRRAHILTFISDEVSKGVSLILFCNPFLRHTSARLSRNDIKT